MSSAIPETMRAAVSVGPRRLAVETRPVPALGPHDALLRVSHCGVCGTDLHLVMEGWGRPDSIGGHEYSGTIVAVGAEVRDWQLGEAVVGGPEASCGVCEYCRTHRPGLCAQQAAPTLGEFHGAFAEYKKVHESQLLRLPAGLALREAALAEPLAVALHGITLSRITPGKRALITGAGPIGMLTLAALRARGVDDITVSEPHARRRELAEAVGARRVMEPAALRPPRMPFDIATDAYDAAFECSGRPEAFEAALGHLVKTGTLVVLGTGMDRPRLDANRMLLTELSVTGAYNYDENGFVDALELLASGRLPTEHLIDARDVPLDGVYAAMEGLVNGEIGGKVLVSPSERGKG